MEGTGDLIDRYHRRKEEDERPNWLNFLYLGHKDVFEIEALLGLVEFDSLVGHSEKEKRTDDQSFKFYKEKRKEKKTGLKDEKSSPFFSTRPPFNMPHSTVTCLVLL